MVDDDYVGSVVEIIQV